MWRPAKSCRECRYPNDNCAKFCQQCGSGQGAQDSGVFPSQAKRVKLDLQFIDERINNLKKTRLSTSYGKQKSHLESEVAQFLSALDPPKTLLSCVPIDIVRFLVWKDQKGRTKVHASECSFIGSKDRGFCNCPHRLAAGTVDSTIGTLRALFNSMERSGEWDDRLGWGNPATHHSVKQYLQSIKAEQAGARVTPKQATPVLFGKF